MRYLKMLPNILYPYIYMICIFIVLNLSNVIDGDMGSLILFGTAIVCNLYVLISSLIYIIQAARGKVEAKYLANLNAIIKIVHIPAYIIHLLLGMLGLLASVWGIGFIMWAIIIDILTIFFSGLIGISASIACKKEGKIKHGFWYSLFSFIYVIDILVSIILVIKSRKK